MIVNLNYSVLLYNINLMKGYLKNMRLIQNYLHYRPRQKCFQKPKEWFKYATKVIIQENRRIKSQQSSNFRLRNNYIGLYKKKQDFIKTSWVQAWLTNKDDEKVFRKLEKQFTFSELIKFREFSLKEAAIEQKLFYADKKGKAKIIQSL